MALSGWLLQATKLAGLETGGALTRSGSAAVRPPGSDLAARLELTFRLLGTGISRASERQLHSGSAGLDNASVPLLAALEEHDGARPSDAAAAVELDLSTVSRQLRQLERLGLRPRGAEGARRRPPVGRGGCRRARPVDREQAAAPAGAARPGDPQARRRGRPRLPGQPDRARAPRPRSGAG